MPESDEAKHIRYVDLSEGGYVEKAKYDDLSGQNTGLQEDPKTVKLLNRRKRPLGMLCRQVFFTFPPVKRKGEDHSDRPADRPCAPYTQSGLRQIGKHES